jgi:hypothetical protein
MGISDYLKAKLSDLPGIEGATSELIGGEQVIHINGAEAHTGPFASDTEIERAIRSALNMLDPEATEPAEPNVTPMPEVTLIEESKQPEGIIPKPDEIKGLDAKNGEKGIAPPPVGKPIPSSGGYTPGSIKTLLQGLRDRQASVMSEVEGKAKRAHQALDRAARIGADLDATADAILAELGQFSNHPDDE